MDTYHSLWNLRSSAERSYTRGNLSDLICAFSLKEHIIRLLVGAQLLGKKNEIKINPNLDNQLPYKCEWLSAKWVRPVRTDHNQQSVFHMNINFDCEAVRIERCFLWCIHDFCHLLSNIIFQYCVAATRPYEIQGTYVLFSQPEILQLFTKC